MSNEDILIVLRKLEDVVNEHARLIKYAKQDLIRVRRDPEDYDSQLRLLGLLNKFRSIRRTIANSIAVVLNTNDSASETYMLTTTLLEYMLLVGFDNEEEIIRRARLLASNGAKMLMGEMDEFAEDLRQINDLRRELNKLLS